MSRWVSRTAQTGGCLPVTANSGDDTAAMAVAITTAVEAPAEDSLSLGGLSARKALFLVATVVLLVVSVVLLAPAFADLPAAWERIRHGDVRWLTLALLFEALSFLGHIVLFSAVSKDGGSGSRIGLWA